jgi:hypothetical protein
MKKLIMIFAMLALAAFANAQATNPQNTFSNAVNVNSPSLWLNFNDATTSFKDSVSGSLLGPTAPGTVGTLLTPSGSLSDGYVVVAPNVTPAGIVNAFSMQFFTAPTAGPYTIVVVSGTAPSFTIAHSFTVTVAATTAIQTFTAPTNFAAFSVSSGERYGYWASSSTQALGYSALGPGPAFYYFAAPSTLPTGANTYTAGGIADQAISLSFAVTVISPGTTTPQQPGFDNTNNANYSASFPYNTWNAAPNNTLSTIDWNSPWTMLLHLDRLNWDRSGTLVLASKGDLNVAAINNVWWELYLAPTGDGTGGKLCFKRSSPAPSTATSSVSAFVATSVGCTALYDTVPNGFNYDIAIEDPGTGNGIFAMWINGVNYTLSENGGTTNQFGGVTVAVTSGGTGYAASTNFTSAGGGAHCTVTGTATATGGVITSAGIFGGNSNYGCTSAPTIVLTAPSGTGAVITATSYPMTMNSSIAPLMVPGYVSNGVYNGIDFGDSSQNPTLIDEFALFPGNLSFGQISNIFHTTKFYQGLLYPGIMTKPPLVILGGYGCGPDFSGDQTLAATIGAAKLGLINLIVVDDDGQPNGSNSVGWWRQMLDQAGLNNVPVSVGPNSGDANTGGCPAANITAVNASTPQNASSYESSVTMYRTLFAKYSTQPIYALVTQTANGYANFLTSAADGISPLTGYQLQAQNAANGGWINMYQGNLSLTPTYYQTIYNGNATGVTGLAMPIYMFGGSPQSGGPGILVSRVATDPLWLTASEMGGGDTILGYTQLNIAQMLSPYFYGGVVIANSGGTGYANFTPFTSTGGGPYCTVAGYMTASSGVPNGILTPWGSSFPSSTSYNGLGYGCFPLYATGIGSGTSLTLSNVFGTWTVGTSISGTGVPAGTQITAVPSGGGAGVYTTNNATTASAATITGLPTIVLTAPIGTGVTLTPALGFVPTCYGTPGCMNEYVVYPAMYGAAVAGNAWTGPVFTWFQNSLMDPPPNGAPRPY